MSFLAHVVGGGMAGLGQGLGAAAKMKYESDLEAKRQEILAQREEKLLKLRQELEQPNKDREFGLQERQVAAQEAAGRSRAEADMLRNQVNFLGQVARLGGASGSGGKSDKLDPTSFVALEQFAMDKGGMDPTQAAIYARRNATVIAQDADGSQVLAYNHNGRPLEIARLPADASPQDKARFEALRKHWIETGDRSMPQEESEKPGLLSQIGSALRGDRKPDTPPDPVSQGISEKAARLGSGDMSPEETAAFSKELEARRAQQGEAAAPKNDQLRAEWDKLDLGSLSKRDLLRARDKYWSVLSDDEKKQLNRMVR